MLIKTNRKTIKIEDIETMATVMDVLMLSDSEGPREILVITDTGDILVERGTEEFEKLFTYPIYKGCIIYKSGENYKTIDGSVYEEIKNLEKISVEV